MVIKPDGFDEYQTLASNCYFRAIIDFKESMTKIESARIRKEALEAIPKRSKSEGAKLAKAKDKYNQCIKNIQDMWIMTHKDTLIIDMVGLDPDDVWSSMMEKSYKTHRPDLTYGFQYVQGKTIVKKILGVKFIK